jgi:hypothetical protein
VEGVKIGRRVFLCFEWERVQGRDRCRFERWCVLDSHNAWNIHGGASLHQHPGCFRGIHRLAAVMTLVSRCALRRATALHGLMVLRNSAHAVRKLQNQCSSNRQNQQHLLTEHVMSVEAANCKVNSATPAEPAACHTPPNALTTAFSYPSHKKVEREFRRASARFPVYFRLSRLRRNQ